MSRFLVNLVSYEPGSLRTRFLTNLKKNLFLEYFKVQFNGIIKVINFL